MPATTELEQALERATSEPALLARIAAAAPENWRAAAWILEHRWPERRALPRDRPEPELDDVPAVADPFAEADQLAQRRARLRARVA